MMNTIQKNKAFTLIELMVVVAIIGITTSVVLVLASNSTSKAQDAAIIASVNQLAKLASIYAKDDGTAVAPNSTGFTSTASTLVAYLGSPADCDHWVNTPALPDITGLSTQVSATDKEKVRSFCKDIVARTTDSANIFGGNTYHIMIGKLNGNTKNFAIQIHLPSGTATNMYVYCASSNGRSSLLKPYAGASDDTKPGCVGDPS